MEATSDYERCLFHAPWGSNHEGKKWAYMPQGPIRKINLSYGDCVHFLKFETYSSEGEVQSNSFGTLSGRWTHTICIDYPDEYLVAISGSYGAIDRFDVVRSICFKTNKNHYGPYGLEGGTVFSHEVKDEVIVGFHGRADTHINAIGVYVMPKSLALCLQSTDEGKVINEDY